MQVQVLLFGVLKDLARRQSDTLTLPEGATVADLMECYGQRVPALKGALEKIAVSVNQEYCRSDAKLHAGDEVALLPPVSGGSPGPKTVPAPIHTCAVLAQIKRPDTRDTAGFEG